MSGLKRILKRIFYFIPSDHHIIYDDGTKGRTWFDSLDHGPDKANRWRSKEYWFGRLHCVFSWDIL